jgi:hypothetical protein
LKKNSPTPNNNFEHYVYRPERRKKKKTQIWSKVSNLIWRLKKKIEKKRENVRERKKTHVTPRPPTPVSPFFSLTAKAEINLSPSLSARLILFLFLFLSLPPSLSLPIGFALVFFFLVFDRKCNVGGWWCLPWEYGF